MARPQTNNLTCCVLWGFISPWWSILESYRSGETVRITVKLTHILPKFFLLIHNSLLHFSGNIKGHIIVTFVLLAQTEPSGLYGYRWWMLTNVGPATTSISQPHQPWQSKDNYKLIYVSSSSSARKSSGTAEPGNTPQYTLTLPHHANWSCLLDPGCIGKNKIYLNLNKLLRVKGAK